MNFAPIAAQLREIWRYTTSNAAAPIGQGFDRWWVLLAKGQVPHGLLWGIAALELAGLVLSALWLRRAYFRAAAMER